MLIFWFFIFIISLIVLVKSSDWLLVSSEKIGLALGMSPFVVGVIIVGVGTSFPELISSLAATIQNVTEIVPANAIGSNIANILLIVGLAAVISGKLIVTKNLIDLDLPLLTIATVIVLAILWDGQVVFWEAVILLLSYLIYLLYSLVHREDQEDDLKSLPARILRRKHIVTPGEKVSIKTKLKANDFVMLAVGIIGLVFGAKYLIEAVINLSQLLMIGAGVIAITAVALGTSLPELMVSVKAALQKKSEIALGNIFGSSFFNMLVVIGLPGLFKTIQLDSQTLSIGVPALALVTLIFVISGVSRKIHIWEGSFYLMAYVLFIAKLFRLF